MISPEVFFLIGFVVLGVGFFYLFVRQQRRLEREGINPSSTIGMAVIEGFEQRLREEVRRRTEAEERLTQLRLEFENYKIETGKIVLALQMELQRIAQDRPRSDTGSYKNLKTGGEMFELLVRGFSMEEMRTLAFALGLDHETIEGVTKDTFARSLITRVDQLQRLPALLALLKQQRPELPWPDYKQ